MLPVTAPSMSAAGLSLAMSVTTSVLRLYRSTMLPNTVSEISNPLLDAITSDADDCVDCETENLILPSTTCSMPCAVPSAKSRSACAAESTFIASTSFEPPSESTFAYPSTSDVDESDEMPSTSICAP